MSASRRAWLVGLFLGGTWAACLEPTQLLIEVSTDVPCERALGVSVTVGAPGEVELALPTLVTRTCQADGTIGGLAVVPQGDRDALVAVKVAMALSGDVETDCTAERRYQGCIVSRRQVRYLPQRTVRVPVELFSGCRDVACDPQSTCSRSGLCVSSSVTPQCSPAGCVAEESVDGGSSGGSAGGSSGGSAGGSSGGSAGGSSGGSAGGSSGGSAGGASGGSAGGASGGSAGGSSGGSAGGASGGSAGGSSGGSAGGESGGSAGGSSGGSAGGSSGGSAGGSSGGSAGGASGGTANDGGSVVVFWPDGGLVQWDAGIPCLGPPRTYCTGADACCIAQSGSLGCGRVCIAGAPDLRCVSARSCPGGVCVMTSGSTGMMVPLVRCEAMVGSTQIAVCTPADPTCPAGTTCQPVPPGPSVLVQWWWSCR